MFSSESEAQLARYFKFIIFIIDPPEDEEATGDDLDHVPIDDLHYDIDVTEEMDSEADQ